jgi:hypothetical protein
MADPSKLSTGTLPELKQIVADFPCFQVARMLYLKNLAVLDDIRLEVELKKTAIHVPDRMKLFLLLEGERYASVPAKAEKKDDKFHLIEDFLLSTGNDTGTDKLEYESAPATDYASILLAGEKTPDPPQYNRTPYREPITSFTGNEGESKNAHAEKEAATGGNEAQNANDDFPEQEKTTPSDSTYFTETLAQIYIRQKRYGKALEIIKKLSLNYPGKNIYFADQIRFLEKLIIHTKNNK